MFKRIMASSIKKIVYEGDGSENGTAAALTNTKDVVWYKEDIESKVTPAVSFLLTLTSRPTDPLSGPRSPRKLQQDIIL